MPRNAMTETAKQERREFIIDKAFELFEEKSFKEFKMIDLAKLCSLSKGSMFNYFKTKEMLFLHMLDREYDIMLNKFENDFKPYDKVDKYKLKNILLKQIDTIYNPESPLIKLNMIKGVILEQNIEYDYAVEHKLRFAKNSQETISRVISKLDGVTPEQFMKLFSVQGTLFFGYMQQVTTSKVIKQVLIDYNLKQFEVDPIKETKTSFEIFYNGYLNIKS